MRLLYLFFLSTVLFAVSTKISWAQAPAWNAATTGGTQLAGSSTVQATTTDAAGNVFVTGYFTGHVAFGNIQLTSANRESFSDSYDLFVAKYVPATGTWAWAQRGGGTSNDYGYGIAVRNGSVYVTGAITNNLTNANKVTFGGTNLAASFQQQNGASSTTSKDIVLAKYTDNGANASLDWTQVGGGASEDIGYGVAVSGVNVYLTGTIFNTNTNSQSVLFGGTGLTAGTVPQFGASSTAGADIVVAKYTDNGSTATLGWTQVGGGTGLDIAQGIAVNGVNVYITGSIGNTRNNTSSVLFGGSGTTAGIAMQAGATSTLSADIVVAKYIDNGSSAALGWTQVGGGTLADDGYGIAVSGNSIYVTGSIYNSTTNANDVVLGGSGVTPGTVRQNGATSRGSLDILVVKYTDNGSSATVAWTQVGGGNSSDAGQAIAVAGTEVYVAGFVVNDIINSSEVVFDGTGTTVGTTPQSGIASFPGIDLVVANFTDKGSTATLAWTQVGGGTQIDKANGIAVSKGSVYVSGFVSGSEPAVFGTAAGSPLLGSPDLRATMGQLSSTTGTWQAVTASANGGTSTTCATAVDATGNVFVTGVFQGQVTFGSTLLSSVGGEDWFVAKYVPATGTWAWAQRGGGKEDDRGNSIAVSGTSVYVTGTIYNNSANVDRVTFGGTGPLDSPAVQHGATSSIGPDLVVAKYTDNGPSATLGWTQVGGGIGQDMGYGVAVLDNNVYVTGFITNNMANSNRVVFGGGGTTAGLTPQYGASTTVSSDIIVVKYTDNGSSATLSWTQVGGGTGGDGGQGIAVSGNNVYVTGSFQNSTTNYYQVLFGGSGTMLGTALQYGATSSGYFADLVLAKYIDNGSSATLGWTQVGGGSLSDGGSGIAVNGQTVYVVGSITNGTTNYAGVVFGGSGTTAGTVSQFGTNTIPSSDIIVAKYLDNGLSATLGWTQVGGGTNLDEGRGIAVSGNNVYICGSLNNSSTNDNNVVFGGAETMAGTLPQYGLASRAGNDIVLAKYLDNGSTATVGWIQTGGGENADIGLSLAISGQRVYVGGFVAPAVTFGGFTATTPPGSFTNVLAWLNDGATPLAIATATTQSLALYPNPAATTAAVRLTGARPGALVQVLTTLGQVITTTKTNAAGTAILPNQLLAGLYLIRCEERTLRLVVN